MKSILAIAFIAMCHTAVAQAATIKGSVKDERDSTVIATISLLKAADSSWVQSIMTDNSGVYVLNNVADGSYVIDVQAFSYAHKQLPISVSGKDVTLDVRVLQQATQLKEVAVTARKPFIEMALGKTIVNVGSSTGTAGSSVLDLLKKSPGVSVDINGNVSMAGKQGVMVLIDDKQTYLSGRELSDYLKAMTADEVAQLELITQPSAKYDAAGNAGIINIKRKRIRKAGLNGSANVAYGQGIYPNMRGSAQLNYRKNKTTLYMNTSHLRATGFQEKFATINFEDAQTGNVTDTHEEYAFQKETYGDNKLRIGADYAATEKTTVGVSATGIYHPNSEHDYSEAVVSNAGIQNYSTTDNDMLRRNALANAYVKHTFSESSNVTIDADWLRYTEQNRNMLRSNNYDVASQQLQSQVLLRAYNPSFIDVYSLKSDYTGTIGKNIKIEAGVKTSFMKTDNDVQYEQHNQGWQPDPLRSSHFIYHENINAAYVSASKAMGKQWQVQAGLRAEQANTSGEQLTTGITFDRSRLALFPTAYVAYALSEINQFEINYGRRINRPDYRLLDPFRYYISQYSYRQGNPYLQPEYAHNLELKHVYKNTLSTSLYYMHSKDAITDVVEKDNGNVSVQTSKNMGTADMAAVSVNLNKQMVDWLNVTFAGTGYYAAYSRMADTTAIRTSGMGYSAYLNTQFTMQKGWAIENMISFNGPSIMTAVARQKPTTYHSLGFSKRLLKDTATLKVDLQDPFGIYKVATHQTTPSLDSRDSARWATQQLAIAFAYNFGHKADKISPRQRESIEESRRMKLN